MNTYLRTLIIGVFCLLTLTDGAAGQTTTVHASGLQGPNKMIIAGEFSLLVAETGTATPNTGRIAILNRNEPGQRTLIQGLPSGFNTVENAPSGPTGLKLVGSKLYVTIGQGDSVIPGVTGGIIPNPHRQTVLNNSILELTLPANFENITEPFTLPRRQQKALADGWIVKLMNDDGRIMRLRLVANLPDFRPETRPGLPPNNVRPANLYGIEMVAGDLYVVDASFNQIYKVGVLNGEYSTVTVFPPKPNPLPFGPPVFESVPDSIRMYRGGLLVTNLTGFPFPQGLAEVRRVDLRTGQHTPFITGLSAAIDVLPVPLAGNNDCFYVLEFSTGFLAQPQAPGRLRLYLPTDTGTLAPLDVAQNLISPTSMARDPETGNLFVTEIFPGRVTRINISEGNLE